MAVGLGHSKVRIGSGHYRPHPSVIRAAGLDRNRGYVSPAHMSPVLLRLHYWFGRQPRRRHSCPSLEVLIPGRFTVVPYHTPPVLPCRSHHAVSAKHDNLMSSDSRFAIISWWVSPLTLVLVGTKVSGSAENTVGKMEETISGLATSESIMGRRVLSRLRHCLQDDWIPAIASRVTAIT